MIAIHGHRFGRGTVVGKGAEPILDRSPARGRPKAAVPEGAIRLGGFGKMAAPALRFHFRYDTDISALNVSQYDISLKSAHVHDLFCLNGGVQKAASTVISQKGIIVGNSRMRFDL